MRNLLTFLILLRLSFAVDRPEPFDLVEDALLRYINSSVSPCENFYRHACSFNSPGDLTEDAFQGINSYLEEIQQNNFWYKLGIVQDAPNILDYENVLTDEQSVINFYTKIFDAVCAADVDEAVNILPIIIQSARGPYSSSREFFLKDDNFSIRENSDKCQKMSQKLRDFLRNIYNERFGNPFIASDFKKNFEEYLTEINAINGILAMDVRDGIEQAREMMKSSLRVVESLIKDTPWAINKNVIETLNNIASSLKLYDNYGADLQNITNLFYKMETSYKKCQREIGPIKNGKLFCLLNTATIFPIKYDASFFLFDNAYNEHPKIALGFPNYYHTQYGKEMAAKFGYTGFTVGHEIGHSFFNDHSEGDLIPYFSKHVEDCVQNQFNSTCTEYKEAACSTDPEALDDNGADIIGLQLAYQLLENFYGYRLKENITRLGVSNEQLFFYSYAYRFCAGNPVYSRIGADHSARNVRINVVAQHPGFKEAFQCSDDSRMMRSKTEQCFIYGKSAPETRKLKNTNNF